MSGKKFLLGALVLGGALASGLAQARGDIQWSLTIGVPIVSQPYPVYTQPVPVYTRPYPVYTQPVPVYTRPIPVYTRPVPVYTQPVPVYARPVPVLVRQPYWYGGRGYVTPTRWDRDGDGIPNRYDRLYNPRWDRDGDGVPNRHDRNDDRGGRR